MSLRLHSWGLPGEMRTRNEGHGSGASIVIWLKLALLERGGLPNFSPNQWKKRTVFLPILAFKTRDAEL